MILHSAGSCAALKLRVLCVDSTQVRGGTRAITRVNFAVMTSPGTVIASLELLEENKMLFGILYNVD